MTTFKKLTLGILTKEHVKETTLGMAFYKQLAAIKDKSHSHAVINFIGGAKVFDALLQCLRSPKSPKKQPTSSLPDQIDMGILHRGTVDDELFDTIVERLNNIEVVDRPKYLLEMALNPSMILNDCPKVNFYAFHAELIMTELFALPLADRVAMLFDGAALGLFKQSSSEAQLKVDTVTFTDGVNIKDAKGRLLVDIIKEEQLSETVAFAKKLDNTMLNVFIVRAMAKYLHEAKGLVFRVENQLPYLFIERETIQPGLPIFFNDTVHNCDFDLIQKMFYDMKNNRFKDRIGASDKAMSRFKANPQAMPEDPAFGLLARTFVMYPDIMIKTLPKEVDIKGLVEYLGGSNRALGVYIGRNAYTGHRYLTKKNENEKRNKSTFSPPQNIEVLLEIFATFIQEGRHQEYIENILIPEAKSRGIDDILTINDWGTPDTDD